MSDFAVPPPPPLMQRQDWGHFLCVSKNSWTKWLYRNTHSMGKLCRRLRAHMLDLKASSCDATSVPSTIAGISLYDACKDLYERNNVMTWSMLLLTYTSLQASCRLVPAITEGTDVASELGSLQAQLKCSQPHHSFPMQCMSLYSHFLFESLDTDMS